MNVFTNVPDSFFDAFTDSVKAIVKICVDGALTGKARPDLEGRPVDYQPPGAKYSRVVTESVTRLGPANDRTPERSRRPHSKSLAACGATRRGSPPSSVHALVGENGVGRAR